MSGESGLTTVPMSRPSATSSPVAIIRCWPATIASRTGGWTETREEASLTNPWATLVGQVQRTLGPHYAGKRLTGFRSVAPNVTESVFEGGFSVLANWSSRNAVEVDGQRLAPHGFLARNGADVLASALGFTWSGVTFPGGAR